jgi:hypothetical protein
MWEIQLSTDEGVTWTPTNTQQDYRNSEDAVTDAVWWATDKEYAERNGGHPLVRVKCPDGTFISHQDLIANV